MGERDTMEEADGELLRRYRRGDGDALGMLVEKYRRPLFGYLINMTSGCDDVDELFQEVWLRVIHKLKLYRQRNFFGWLIRIAHNLVIDRARKRKPDFSLDAETRENGEAWVDRLQDKSSDPVGRIAENELGQRIAEAVKTLPMQQREVFLMRSHTGLSFKEIASIQRVSINTALARMQYALAKLRPMLERDYNEL